MTEIQGAIASEQLKKLNTIIKDNSIKMNALKKIIEPYFETRLIPKGSKCINDTLIIFQKNKFKRLKIIEILKNAKFGTKNLPDAMEWHCSYFWSHALKKSQVQRSKKTFKILNTCIAIPIWKKKTINDYKKIAKQIIKYR
jgi:8-amino-3,8-dideoxy-alpha-D-manno-octulosonate transaminase